MPYSWLCTTSRTRQKTRHPELASIVTESKYNGNSHPGQSLYVLCVVLWIGGVTFVTTVLLPSIRQLKTPAERVDFFETIEGRFAWQARVTTLLVGITGFYLAYLRHLWPRFNDASCWWMHLMIGIRVLISVMLFVAAPIFLHRWFRESAA